MNYQELMDVLRKRSAGFTNMQPTSLQAPTLEQIISGIQSQYQAPQFQQPQFQAPQMPSSGAGRFVGGPQTFAQQNISPVAQSGLPSFTPGAFDLAAFTAKPSVSDVIDTISSDTGGSSGGNNGSTGGLAVDDAGLATSSNISPGMVGALATGVGMVTGLPVGLVANVVGKNTIADAINTAGYNAAVAQNNALVANQMGLNPSDPVNSAALASAIDALSSSPTGTTVATPGTAGTGGAAAAAGSAAAAAAAAAGHSDAAIGAAAQAAADAAIGGASAADAAAAASDAANAAAADAADADGGGIGTAATDGIGGVTGVSAADGGGGGGGGGKIICTKLHELGLMPKNIYEADQAFGLKLVNESPETYYGYVRWAKHIVSLMGRDDLLGKTTVFCAYHIATPWSIAMAEEMGQPVKASWFGKFLMKRGLQFCKLVGSGNKQTAVA